MAKLMLRNLIIGLDIWRYIVDAGASSTITRGETTQHLSAPLNHFRILTAGVSCKSFFEMIENKRRSNSWELNDHE
jgi:hypothetical protein